MEKSYQTVAYNRKYTQEQQDWFAEVNIARAEKRARERNRIMGEMMQYSRIVFGSGLHK